MLDLRGHYRLIGRWAATPKPAASYLGRPFYAVVQRSPFEEHRNFNGGLWFSAANIEVMPVRDVWADGIGAPDGRFDVYISSLDRVAFRAEVLARNAASSSPKAAALDGAAIDACLDRLEAALPPLPAPRWAIGDRCVLVARSGDTSAIGLVEDEVVGLGVRGVVVYHFGSGEGVSEADVFATMAEATAAHPALAVLTTSAWQAAQEAEEDAHWTGLFEGMFAGLDD